MAADAEHADPRCRLACVVSAWVAPGYVASTEPLARTGEGSEFATGVCIPKEGVDPATGGAGPPRRRWLRCGSSTW